MEGLLTSLPSRRSWLHRLDSRVKLLFIAEAVLVSLIAPGWQIALALLLASHVLLIAARISARRLLSFWKLMLPLTVLVPLLWLPMIPDGQPLLATFWRIRITMPAVIKGLTMACRLDALAFAFFVWLATTDQRDIVQGMVQMGLPFKWGLTLSLSLRFLPTLRTTYSQIVDAQRSRGLDLSRGSLLQRARDRLPLLVTLLVSALRGSETVGRALEARALGASGVRRTSLREVRLSRFDLLCLAVLLAMGAGTGVLLLR